MIPILLDGPETEPLSLNEAKAWLKIDGDDENDLIQALVVAARLMVEAEIGQVLLGQTWRLTGDNWPGTDAIPVRIGRIIAIAGARVFGADGQPSPIAPESFTILPGHEPSTFRASLCPAPGRASNGIEIDLRLGFGETAADLPETIRLTIRRLIALWYENRGDAGEAEAGLPPQIRALLRPFRRIRL